MLCVIHVEEGESGVPRFDFPNVAAKKIQLTGNLEDTIAGEVFKHDHDVSQSPRILPSMPTRSPQTCQVVVYGFCAIPQPGRFDDHRGTLL